MNKERTIIPKEQIAVLRRLKEREDAVGRVFPTIKEKLIPLKCLRQAERIAARRWEEWSRRRYLDEMNA